MADLIKIDTAQVLEIANKLSGLNDELQTNLKEAQSTITNLETIWQGEAATATIDAVNSFAADYFQNYYDLINQYVEFLKKNVAQGYEETENVNKTLAESFK